MLPLRSVSDHSNARARCTKWASLSCAGNIVAGTGSGGGPDRVEGYIEPYSEPGCSTTYRIYLNLFLVSPSGYIYTAGSAISEPLQLDNVNNTEVIRVNNPTRGRWWLRVVASNVPHGPQEYAFMLSGNVTA